MSIPAFQSLPFNTRQLAEQVPAWLTAASVAQRAHYRERLLAHLRSAARGASIHRRLLTPAQFCEPLLVQALVRRFNLEVDVNATEWVRVDYHYSLEGRRRQPHRQTLLEAAMGNFEAQEDFAPQALILPVGEYRLVLGPVLGYRYDPRAVLPITPQAFAALCRELDMGGQYQAHLQAVLAPAPSSVLGAWPQDSIRRQIADALLVQVNCAQIKGAIDTSTAALLEALLGEGIAPSWQGGAVQVCRLRALVTWVHSGTPLAGAVLVRSQADPEGPCVLYLPGAEAEPLKQFDSFAAMAIALRQRLRDRGFQAFFQRFVPCAERGEFFARLLNTLSPQPFSLLFPKPREDDPDADIGVRADALATGLVEQLRLDMLATVLGDARWCVVPTDDEDRKTRDRRLQQMLALGLDVQREARIEAMERILAVWQRDPGHINYEDDQVSGYELDLSDLPLGQLPALTADFSHVQQLVLDGVGTNHDPSPFLRAFTSLRGVDMCRNGLLTIPEAVATLPMLRDLHLGANQLLASDDMFRSLAGLSSLESLDVQNMPLEIPPGAFAQLARLPSLRDLALSGTAQALSDQTLVGVASLSRLQ
ncbi:dermonecrotic toxin domain-containing protein [Pseudomonas sp.]|uniref:dermonecrotic toxin domain-containing protein n=1 Tax=Pseudomonas sp. TaxID=306 RepID=UPI003CC5A610